MLFKSKLSQTEINNLSLRLLAGLGDAVSSLVERERAIIVTHSAKQMHSWTQKRVNAHTQAQDLAKHLGAVWAGDSKQKSPVELDAALIFAPSGELVPLALQAIKKGGSVVCAGIYMSDIPSFPYAWLYGERVLRSVTNLTREDGEEFFNILQQAQLKTIIHPYPLEEANEALMDLKNGKLTGSAVLVIHHTKTSFPSPISGL